MHCVAVNTYYLTFMMDMDALRVHMICTCMCITQHGVKQMAGKHTQSTQLANTRFKFVISSLLHNILPAMFIILYLQLLTCWCTIPMVYSTSFLFSNSLVAFAVIFFFLFITSQVNMHKVVLLLCSGTVCIHVHTHTCMYITHVQCTWLTNLSLSDLNIIILSVGLVTMFLSLFKPSDVIHVLHFLYAFAESRVISASLGCNQVGSHL